MRSIVARDSLLPGRLATPPIFVLLVVISAGPATGRGQEERPAEHQRMLAAIESDASRTYRQTGRRRFDAAVMRAMAVVPRHEFVPADLRRSAYENRPLPIGYGQTISQPYIVALMTELLEVGEGDRVLEVGTGSAYQAAILAQLVERVFTIEIVPPLARQAERRLDRLGYANVESRLGDGYYGWKEHAPFDAIIVTAAASHVPPPLVAQLAPGGIMVIPVGSPFQVQQLMLIRKTPDGEMKTRQVLPVAFVPLTGEH